MSTKEMKTKSKKSETVQHVASDEASDQLNRVDEVYNQTKQAVTEAYDRTSQAISGGYVQARSFGRDNPGMTTVLILGLGLGIGYFLSSRNRHSRSNKFAQPVVNALSDVAMAFFR